MLLSCLLVRTRDRVGWDKGGFLKDPTERDTNVMGFLVCEPAGSVNF